jgi:indolepyruvate ferredoxin oxidoreductase
VLAVSGDDHAAQSSMYPHQTDGIFQSASMPVLQPASVAK